MDGLAQLNRDVAEIVGIDGRCYTEDLREAWKLVEYATRKGVEYSLFAMVYDRRPIYMASFIRGRSQRTSTGDCPTIATCKAFVMMFAGHSEENGEPLNS